MITVEKDLNAEEIFIHATPEDLRKLAKKLWEIAEEGEIKGTKPVRFTQNPSINKSIPDLISCRLFKRL